MTQTNLPIDIEKPAKPPKPAKAPQPIVCYKVKLNRIKPLTEKAKRVEDRWDIWKLNKYFDTHEAAEEYIVNQLKNEVAEAERNLKNSQRRLSVFLSKVKK